MVDNGQLSGDADFPEVNIEKYGWLKFVELDAAEVEQRCWRCKPGGIELSQEKIVTETIYRKTT